MQDISIKFQGSPQKFGKAAYCDLIYTQSKLYDNVLYKDLINFKDVWNFKSEALTLGAMNQYLEDKYSYSLIQKNTIIETQQQEIKFLKQKNRQLADKNIQRVNKILGDHKSIVQSLLNEKQEQTLFCQSEKQVLQKRIEQLQIELSKNVFIVNNIEKERYEIVRKENQMKQITEKLETKIKELQNGIEQMQKQHKTQIKNMHDQKLQIELHFKKQMIEHSQAHKHQIQDLQRFYVKKLQLLQEEKLRQSLTGKQSLNRLLKNYESKSEQNKLKSLQFKQLIQKLSKQLEYQKQKNLSLTGDITKQDDILDKYQSYLKESDQNILNLKQLLLQSQSQLQKAKVSLQKNQLDRDSLITRIKICQEQAKMWRQSYYLNKSRAFNDN